MRDSHVSDFECYNSSWTWDSETGHPHWFFGVAVVFPPIVRQSGFLASRQINKNKDKEIPELDGEWQNEELPKLNLLDVSEAGGVEAQEKMGLGFRLTTSG